MRGTASEDGAGRAAVPAAPFAIDDEVARDLATVDWAATPLGEPAGWPQSLRTALGILLTSRFPMWMAWGEELTFFCNAAYRRDTLGRKYPWALGRPASEVWAEIWDEVGPRIRSVLETGVSTWDEALLLFLERSGYSEETYHTFSYSPLRDDADSVVGMLCVVTEDTDRVVAERRMTVLRHLGSDLTAVRTEEEMLAFTSRQLERNLRTFPFTVTYLFDEDGTVRRAAASGIRPDHPAAPAVLSVREEPALWPVAAAARGEAVVVELEGRFEAPLPTGVWAEPPTHAVVQPLPRQGGDPYGFLVAAVNRYRPLDGDYRAFIELAAGHIAAGIASARISQTQRRRAEELTELDRAKTAFFSNVSHEFRTPLTLITGPVEELRSRLSGADPQTREELEVVRRNALRLGKLVNTLLEFSRIEAGRVRARFAPTDLGALTAEFAGVFRSAMESAGLVLEVDCPALPEPVYLDRELWEKVVLNLLSNALKFTFEGHVRVTVRADGERALVTVADTGIGVPEAELPRLFERFHRIENARARSTEGSGIGLALVRELMELQGGTITASSVGGRGTAFTLALPFGSAHLPRESVVAAPDADAAALPDPSGADAFVQEALRWLPAADRDLPVEPAASGLVVPAHVLVVDDNADMREYLVRLLRGAGHSVAAVPDGAGARDALRSRLPDLVISDVMMPGMSGLELVAALRQAPHTAGVPVMLLSARAGQEASIEGLEAGADDYLVKPFNAAELLARVRANVELSRLRGHHARWRNALVDSLQDAFFVADEEGAIVEVNAAFGEILGYGPEGLPYRPRYPWWPRPQAGPDAERAAVEAFERARAEGAGRYAVPVTHRDGRRIWISVAFNAVLDPETGRRMSVGTFRDVTAERYAIQRGAAVAAVSLRLSQSTGLDEALAGTLEEIRGLWHAERASAFVFTADEDAPVLAAPPAGTPEATGWEALDERSRADLAALRDGPLLVAGPVGDVEGGAGVGLEHPHGTLVLWLDLGRRRPFTDQDRLLLSLLAGHLAQGLRRAHQIDQQRETALALQRAILGPSILPPGFAVRYEPAARPLEVGGDWYDTVELPDGRIGIVVGDCVGRGLEAATVMGQLRSACRALLLHDPRPDGVLAALDRFASGIPGALCTTVFCGVLDPATGTLTYSSAGHPPGIVARADGTTALLDGARSLPLAVRPDEPRPCAVETVPARATVLLYTDGLVERRGRSLTDGIAAGGFAVRDERDAGVEELLERVMGRMAPAEGFEDDVAALLYRHPGPFETVLRTDPDQLGAARAALRRWLERCELSVQTTQKVLVAVGEACTNAVEHAHPGCRDGTVRVRAEVYAEHIRVSVTDDGQWREQRRPPEEFRGHGTKIMKALAEEFALDTRADGTVVTLLVRIDP